MTAKEWTKWFGRKMFWAASMGCSIKKAVISSEQEEDWDKAYLDDVLGKHGLSLDEKTAMARLCGVQVMFTDKLSNGRALFVLEDVSHKEAA